MSGYPLSTGEAVQHARLVPVLVKREEALRALAEGKTIRRGHAVFSGGFEPWRHCAVVILAEAMFDDTACWEILS